MSRDPEPPVKPQWVVDTIEDFKAWRRERRQAHLADMEMEIIHIAKHNPDANLWAESDRIVKRVREMADAEEEREIRRFLDQARRDQRERMRALGPNQVSGTKAADANIGALAPPLTDGNTPIRLASNDPSDVGGGDAPKITEPKIADSRGNRTPPVTERITKPGENKKPPNTGTPQSTHREMDSLATQAYEKQRIARIRVQEKIKEIERLKRLKPGDPIPGMDKKDSDRFTPNPPIPTRVKSLKVRFPKSRIGLILEFLGMTQAAGEMGKGAAFLDQLIAIRKKAEAELVRLKDALEKAKIESIWRTQNLDNFRNPPAQEGQGKSRGE